MYVRIKRIIDLLMGTILFVLLLPVIGVIALGLYIFNHKEVIFKQKRVGKNEQIFYIFKFKTMNDCRDDAGELLPDFQRMTKLGHLLRKTSLDELPQLLNIIKGEMSFIGPRPLLVDYLPLYTAEQAKRHLVTPGMTGLAQVKGRNTLSWEEKFTYDVEYVKRNGLKMDGYVLVKTVQILLNRKGVNNGKEETMERFVGMTK
jgi:lipopolysaccharide/colanic/teichoic acid biosynthesis glycosyltransferase